MIVKIGYPPIIDEIRKVFPVGKNVVFAWGDTIYNPDGGYIPPEIILHEEVHGRRQEGNPESWWAKYLTDKTFRLEEELLAHRVEYQAYVHNHKDYNAHAKYLYYVAGKLSSPLYGSMLTPAEAKREILDISTHLK